MKPSNWKKKIRNFSVHLTRLTVEDIDRIRCQVNQEAVKKGNQVPKAKKRKQISSNSKSFEATASSKSCILNSAIDDLSLQNRSQETKTRTKRKAISSSSKCSKKRKCSPNRRSSKHSSKTFVLDFRTAALDYNMPSTSDESDMEEVFVPGKIWVSPSARVVTVRPYKSVTAPETHIRETPKVTESNITSISLIRRPIILMKRMSLDVKYEDCDNTIPYNCSVLPGNISNINCCQKWQKEFQRSGVQAKTISSGFDERDSESEESVDEKVSQHFEFEDDKLSILQNEVAPSDSRSKNASTTISKESAEWEITGHSPPLCSYQLTVASTETVTTVVQTNETEASFQTSLLTNELAEASTPNTVLLKDVTTAERIEKDVTTAERSEKDVTTVERNEKDGTTAERSERDDAICSPVIFGEESQATQEFQGEVSSPVIFGSNEGTDAGSGDASKSHNQLQEETSDFCDSSSSFVLELSLDEQLETESSSKNGVLTSDASQNFNLQLSENIPYQNVQSSGNSPELFSSCSFGSEMPGKRTVKDSSDSRNLQLFSRNTNVLSSKTKQISSLSHGKASSNLSGNEVNITERENTGQFKYPDFSGNKKVPLSALKDEKHSESNTIRLFAKPSNLFDNQKALFVVEPPSSSKSRKTCLSLSQVAKAANIPMDQSTYLFPSERLNPSSHQKSNSFPTKGTKLPASVPINNRNDAFTQVDLQEVHQQPPQMSVNYIINTASVSTIRFEGPVVNHPSAITALGEKIPASGSIFAPETHHCPRVSSTSQTKRIPCKCKVGNCSHCSKITDLPKSDDQLEKSSTALASATTKLPACCSDSGKPAKECCGDSKNSQVLASRNTIDSIDLTDTDEPKCAEPPLGRIRLKTPTELGCTIVFTDDVERLIHHELPKLECNSDRLELLQEKHYNLFDEVLHKYDIRKPLKDTLQELCNTRRVPSGSNLLIHSQSARLSLV